MKGEIFYAKIMLFGEYSVIFDSMGLTVPYSHFTGELSFINFGQYTDYEAAMESNRHLLKYLQYLQNLKAEVPDPVPLDLAAFERDISEGLYFESNIPQGYGIGSSGALVAAIYERYIVSKTKTRKILTSHEITDLKSTFSRMESYFHGFSSGIDPLLCYIRHPLLIRSRSQIEMVGVPGVNFDSNHAIFLLDTGTVGQTGPLVQLFLERCKSDDYSSRIKKILIPVNNSCIIALLEGKMESFFTNLEILSSFQYDNFPEMIPASMKTYWESGLKRDDFKLKLCGSGGGGFLLGFSRDFKSTRRYFHHYGYRLIPVYKND